MTLAALLVEASSRLSERVLLEMYEDPFWQARFGERGRTHSRNDGDFHIKYLAEALQSDDARVFASYARWLREVLVTRGMCSRHLAENFRRLGAAIDEEPWTDRTRAVVVLEAGAHALVHTSGAAAEVDQVRARAEASRELDTILSYLADALAYEQPAWVAAYTTFARGLRPTVDAELAAARRLVASEPRALAMLEAA